MFIVRYFSGDSPLRKFFQYGLNVHQGIAPAIHYYDRRSDITGRVPGDLGVLVQCVKTQRRLDIVIEHLERLVPDDLKPVNDGFCASERVQMRVRREFLTERHVVGLPTKEKVIAHVDQFDENRRIEDALPRSSGAENGASTKEKKENLWRSLDKSVHNTILQPWNRHGRRKRNEDIDLLVQPGID